MYVSSLNVNCNQSTINDIHQISLIGRLSISEKNKHI